jgi:hypothetical protein
MHTQESSQFKRIHYDLFCKVALVLDSSPEPWGASCYFVRHYDDC